LQFTFISSATSLDSDTHLDDSCTTEDPSIADNYSGITDCIQQFLEEQQVACDDATSTETALSFDLPLSIHHQMICDICTGYCKQASKQSSTITG